jgi:hypothetical protein
VKALSCTLSCSRSPNAGCAIVGALSTCAEQVTQCHGLWRSLVSALDWGSRGRGFKSRQPDQKYQLRAYDLSTVTRSQLLVARHHRVHSRRGGRRSRRASSFRSRREAHLPDLGFLDGIGPADRRSWWRCAGRGSTSRKSPCAWSSSPPTSATSSPLTLASWQESGRGAAGRHRRGARQRAPAATRRARARPCLGRCLRGERVRLHQAWRRPLPPAVPLEAARHKLPNEFCHIAGPPGGVTPGVIVFEELLLTSSLVRGLRTPCSRCYRRRRRCASSSPRRCTRE